jgi:DNA-binding transcriptional ArsR family regulator
MKEGPDIASLAALIGDPARANMLSALLSGLALTAGELAREADITAQTSSTHLAKLSEAGLIVIEVQGRHRYARLAGPEVATALEGLMGLASRMGRLRTRPGPRDASMRLARVCYDHLAGEMGVRMHDAFVAKGLIVLTPEGLGLSALGRVRFIAEGIDLDAQQGTSRAFCRACLDWSERRHHLAGLVGAQLLQLIFRRGWAKRDGDGRAVCFTPRGQAAFEEFLDHRSEDLLPSAAHRNR